jgi:glycosyltransferase involved in cell wall biosynthesis
MGRFDRQKGMERVLAIANRLAATGSGVRLRVVGERLLDAGEALNGNGASIDWAAATHDPEQLCRHYEWADVLLLPSHWEGLPLSVIEAQLFGVVPVVADVGAVDEAVEHGRTGFLLDHTDVVRQAVEVLDVLATDRARLVEVSQRAHEQAITRTWDESVGPLIRWLERKLKRPSDAAPKPQLMEA